MSKATTVIVGERGFWALDDAFSVWFGYLADQIELGSPDPWLAELARDWRVATEVTDFGADAGDLTAEQSQLLHAIATDARQRALDAGDVPRDFTRTGEDHVRVVRVLEVADGFLGLLDGTLPADPPTGVSFLGTGDGPRVMEHRPEYLTEPRFPRK